ncbi:hypothetical protein [Brevundimonas sp.]|uniref:hypothetical protein n=1 Tax=Brevundimonas sp. TaxID=1871086 RepID=UPI0028A5AAB6|nr:hypothetical protein [Brevundimonas sp.]
MLSVSILFALLLATPLQSAPATEPQSATLPDVEVTGVPERDAVQGFVGRVAAPATGRGLARWRGPICPATVNLRAEAAQPILDRVSDISAELHLRPGQPGCDPNLVIIFTNDGSALAQKMVENDARLFRVGVSGFDRGQAPLQAFRTSEKPVRWWSLSMPVDKFGSRAVRVPGDQPRFISPDIAEAAGCGGYDCPIAFAPIVEATTGSRLTDQTVDALYKVIVIVDLSKTGSVSAGQLGDYIAMISLAQIDVAAETSSYETVLNLFDDAGPGMTDWDRAYLHSLYSQYASPRSANAQAGLIVNNMRRRVHSAP